MAPAGTRGDDRAKPEWGKTASDPAKPPARAKAPAPSPKPKPKAAAPPPSHARRKSKAAAKPPARRAAPSTSTRRPAARTRTRPARPKGSARSRSSVGRRIGARYAVVYDTSGPRVRLGICWFVVALVAVVIGPVAVGLVYGAAAAVAAAQMSRAWRKEGVAPSETMAAGGAALIAMGACFGAGGAGLGILGAVALAYLAGGEPGSSGGRLGDAGWTLQCALVPGVVAMSMVLLARLDQGSAVALLLLVSVYEIGDYLIGSGAQNPFEGPAAGIASIVVITFIVSTLPISSLDFGQAWLFGGLVAVLAPAGQLLGSAVLPSASTPASALRRLDSLLLVAPLWAWGVGLVL